MWSKSVMALVCMLCTSSAWAEETVREETPAPEAAVERVAEHAGWTFRWERRRGQALREVKGQGPGGWRVSASVVTLGASGFVARGRVRLIGPGAVYVTAERVTFASGALVAERESALVGQGWTLGAKKIEVDMTSGALRMEGVGRSTVEGKEST